MEALGCLTVIFIGTLVCVGGVRIVKLGAKVINKLFDKLESKM